MGSQTKTQISKERGSELAVGEGRERELSEGEGAERESLEGEGKKRIREKVVAGDEPTPSHPMLDSHACLPPQPAGHVETGDETPNKKTSTKPRFDLAPQLNPYPTPLPQKPWYGSPQQNPDLGFR